LDDLPESLQRFLTEPLCLTAVLIGAPLALATAVSIPPCSTAQEMGRSRTQTGGALLIGVY
jgi:hypothetical protein